MFLKNVPPVVALHTEWRSYGPTRNFSLPLCFNDSDSDISTTGTPIPEKVQMIIDSLRNTESSIDMSDEYEGTLQTGQAPTPGCPSKTFDVVHKARHRATLGGPRKDDKQMDSLEFGTQSQDSDSDDSVDRGIEEAIQEYLKKKGDRKRKLDPSASPSPVPKHLKRDCPLSDTSKNSDSNIILTANSNHITKSVKTTYSVVTERKRIRSERHSEENHLLKKKGDTIKAVKTFPSFEKKKCLKQTSNSYKGQNLCTSKLEDESLDSSSDDGIEEAIRHYQLEKIKENSADFKKTCKLSQPNEESDSSSDDGIEEAIRRYQLEKRKEESKHVTKASKDAQPKQAHGSKAAALCLNQSGTQAIKKQKVFTKKRRTERNSIPVLSAPASSSHTLCKPLDIPNIKDNGISLTKSKIPSEKRNPAPLKVNTTAELMCAEAILDISKAVMPEAFERSATLPNNCVPSTFQSQDRMSCVENKTDESSIDSDDGIEQEIRKFLELKAQMHSQPSGTTNFPGTQEHAMSPQQKRRVDPTQNKKLRLSLSQKRKYKEEDGNICKVKELDSKLEDKPHLLPLAVHDNNNMLRTQAGASEEMGIALHVATTTKMEGPTKNSEQKLSVSLQDAKDLRSEGDSHRPSLKNEVSKSLMLAERRAQTGDKSSSLDSDEDLDAAIKDLLLTKKRVKRKTRDRKLKSRKCVHFGAVQLCLVDELESEKKTPVDYENFPNSKITKSCISKSGKVTPKQNSNGRSIKPKLSKNTSEQLKASSQVKDSSKLEQIGQKKGLTDVEPLSRGSHLGAALVEQDSSSVDSDDSIEQEIRKFLAEKAKLSMVRAKDGEEIKDSTNNPTDSMTEYGIKMTQQAEIPSTIEIPYKGVPDSGVSGLQGCWERKVLISPSLGLEGCVPQSAGKGSSVSLASTSNSSASLLPDKELNTVKATKVSGISLKKSTTEKTGPGMEKVMSVSEISPVSPSYKAGNNYMPQELRPLAQLSTPVSQSLFKFSPHMPVKEVHVTNISDLPAHETNDTVCPAARNHENANQDEFIAPSPQSSKMSITAISPFAPPTPTRQADKDLRLGEVRGNNPCPPGNAAQIQMDQPLFLELASRGHNYVEMKSRDLSKGGVKKDCTGEREESQREGGDIVREGYEECIDETGDESEESPSASQRSRGKRQFPRLFLSTTIDPGESFRPYIILNSPERNLRFSRRSIFVEDQQNYNLKTHADTQKQMPQKDPERIRPSFTINVKTFYSRISPCTVTLTKKTKKKKLVKRKLQFQNY